MEQAVSPDQTASHSVEGRWWQQFGASLGATQFLGSRIRKHLVLALSNEADRCQAWALEPCAWLGLFDRAWRIQESLPKIDFGWVRKDSLRLREYARWTLGAYPQGPEDISSLDREAAFRVLSRLVDDPRATATFGAATDGCTTDLPRAVDGWIAWAAAGSLGAVRVLAALVLSHSDCDGIGHSWIGCRDVMVMGERAGCRNAEANSRPPLGIRASEAV